MGTDRDNQPGPGERQEVQADDRKLTVIPEQPGRYVLDEHPVIPQRDSAKTEPRSELGRGGIGRVLLAYDSSLGREVAIKELLPDSERSAQDTGDDSLSGRSAVVARFLQEARVTGQLEHPNIVPVYELGKREDDTLYYSMKVVRGRTLDLALRECVDLAGRMKLLSHFTDLCHAVGYAHSRGVVHRDIKPQNVMVGEFGETVLLDWGLAKVRGQRDMRAKEMGRQIRILREAEKGLTVDGTMMGTPAYMSPEQKEGRIDEIDERSDVWSLGAVLHELLVGYDPTEADTLMTEIDPTPASESERESKYADVPAELVSVCEKALSESKGKRYASAKELADEIEAFQAGGRVQAYEYGTWDLLKRFASRHKLLLATVAVALAIIVVLSVATYQEVVSERNVAVAAERTAREAERVERIRRAEAQWEGARAAMTQGHVLEARAKLRGSLEALDSGPGRALWWVLAKDPLVWKRALGAPIYDVAYSPDGRLLAVACADKSVYLLAAETQAVQRILRGHQDQALEVEFASEGKYLVSTSWAGEVIVWDLVSGGHTLMPEKHKGAIYTLDVSPNGWYAATGGIDRVVRMWDIRAGKLARKLEGHSDMLVSARFSPDGKLLATGSFDKTIRFWDVDPYEEPGNWRLGKMIEELPRSAMALDFSPDGQLLAAGCRDSMVRIYSTLGDRLLHTLAGHGTSIWGMAFSPDGKLLASSSVDRTVRLWDPKSGRLVRMFGGATDGLRRVDFRPDGKQLAVASWDKSVRVYAVAVGEVKRYEVGHTEGVHEPAFSPDGKMLATGGRDSTIRLWDVETGEQIRTWKAHDMSVWGMGFAPDAAYLASSGDQGKVYLWQWENGRSIQELIGPKGGTPALEVSPDGRLIASGSMDNTVRVWEVDPAVHGSGKARHVLQGHKGDIWDVAFSPDGKLLASASRDQTIRLWSLASGKSISELRGHTGEIWGLAFSPDGKLLASAGADGTLRLWDPAKGTHRILTQQPIRIYWIAFHPDGKRIGTSGSDRIGRIWNIDSGQFIEIKGHRGEVNFFRFSPDGKLAVTTSDDHTVRLWDTDSGRPYWRAPVLLSDGGFYSHRGWIRLGAEEQKPPPASMWRDAIADRAATASEATGQTLLCMGTFHDELELWDLATDQRVFVRPLPEAERVVAVPGGCLALADGQVRLYDRAGEFKTLVEQKASAIAWDSPDILVAAERKVRLFSARGDAGPVFDADVGITTLARSLPAGEGDDRWLILGYREGNLELISLGTGERREGFSFEGIAASPVVSLLAGKMNTVVVGYGNGLAGLWSLDTGKRLDHARLHGSVVHLMSTGSRIFAATELGSFLEWDARVFGEAHCDLLREVWRDVRVVWEGGRPLLRPPPAGHPCWKASR